MKIKITTLFIFIFCLQFVQAQTEPDSVYMFCYFKNNGQDGLHLAYSYNGFSYTALNNDNSFLKPEISKDKLMRDPCIIRGADGLFHMVWTVSWTAKGIGYASSEDLIHWSRQQYIPLMENVAAKNCWAPEITYDAKTKTYMIYWATTVEGKYPTDTTVERGYNHRIYYVTTKNFKQYSKVEMLYDKGFNVIDATIVPFNKQFIMFLKDETLKPVPQKNIHVATSNQLTKDYSDPSASITGNYWAEGPTAINIKDNWIVYFDKYRDHQYGAVTSSDLKNWTDISDKISMPKGIRHGTVFSISSKEFKTFFK
jgi:hypothetical protein